jgi:CPA2 family monovalent cation:H+ antiporter-2
LQESNLAGQTLRDIRIREIVGILLLSSEGNNDSGSQQTERLFPGDEICVIGSDEQVKEFADFLTKHEIEILKKLTNEVILKQIELQIRTLSVKA